MTNKHFFNSVLIGDDSVTLECFHLLLEMGNQVNWIVTCNPKIEQCARIHGVKYSSDLAPLRLFLETKSIDYLFSIVNNKIIPEDVLKKISVLCINYHNSLLPTYAGLHAVPMAILNQETQHGITWHVMTNEIDAGDILKQKSFTIDHDETAHTLYVKCSFAAIQTFRELVIELQYRSYKRSPQDMSLRTFFGKEYHVPNFGFIDWHDTADNIDTLCRALFFENKENLLGHPKTIIGHECYLIKSIKKLTHITNTVPGIITNITDKFLQISTGSQDVEISSIYTCEGQPVNLKSLIDYSGLEKNKKFNDILYDSKPLLKEYFFKADKHKNFWLDQINSAYKCPLPLLPPEPTYQFKSRINPKHIEISSIIKMAPIEKKLDTTISSILVLLYRLAQYKNLSVKLNHDNLTKLYKRTLTLSPYVLLTTNFSPFIPFDEARNEISQKVRTIYEKETFLRDLWLRRSKNISCNDIPVALIITDRINDSYFIDHHQLYFFISTDGAKVSVFCREENNMQMITFYKNISNYLRNILERVIVGPDIQLNKIPMDNDTNLEKIKELWNATEMPSRYKQKTIHTILQDLSRIHPHKVAVTDDCGYLTYLQLYNKSKLFAEYIRSEGICSGDFVSIYMDRSLELFITLFGVLCAGAAYVPIDMDYPLERINYILTDSGAKAIIYKKNTPNIELLKKYKINMIGFDSAFEIAPNVDEIDIAEIDGESLCYIIYTSGSTGKPKGVMISHKNVLNYSSWFSDSFNFKEQSAIEFSSSIAFDLSISCTIVPILNGGKVIICHEETKADPYDYLNFIKANNVTHIECTPAYMSRLLDHPLLIARLTQLKWVLLGCDTLVKSDVERWMNINPLQKIVNEYGPTECTVAMTQHTMTNKNINAYGNCIPIGKPAHNIKTYILDDYYNICPPGFLGELYITGESLSLGYLNKPDIQAKKFISSKFEQYDPYNRLYATGDLAFYHDDGAIEFMGRKDNQVKIRGYRVEPQEIEAVILTYPDIKQCTVITIEGTNRDLRLEAYLVSTNKNLSVNQIYDYLKAEVPPYMIPKKIYFIDNIPVNFSGKIDRKALENHATVDFNTGNQNLSEVTRNLIEIWADIFQSKNFQITDDFFELGGDSLSAMMLIAKVKEIFNVKLMVKDILENSILINLSEVIERSKNACDTELYDKYKSIFLIRPANSGKNIFLIHPIGGGVFWYNELSKKINNNFSVYAIQDPSFESREILFNSIEQMASFYIELIKTVQPNGNYVLGGASFGATVAFEMSRQLELIGEKVDFIAMFDGWAVYPEQLKDEKSFKKIMKAQRKRFLEKYQDSGIENIHELLAIQQHRSMLLQKYQPKPIKSKIVLFKATENWDLFESIQSEDNYWRPLSESNLVVEPASGNHETMLFEPHIQTLTSKLNKYLEEICIEATQE